MLTVTAPALFSCELHAANFYFQFLLAAVIMHIVGENKENKVYDYVLVNWILSVQAELGTHASSLPARNNDAVCREQSPL